MNNKIKTALRLLTKNPDYLKVGVGFRARNLLRGRKNVNCVVSSLNDTRFFLGEDPVDEIILRHLFTEFQFLYFPANLAFEENDLVIDVGTHHGLYLSELLKRNEGLKAIAIEPDINSIKYIKKNLSLNNLSNRVEVINAAISEHDGIGSLMRSDEGSWGNSIVEGGHENNNGEKINLLSLENLVSKSRFTKLIVNKEKKFKLLKINAEGGEFTILPLFLNKKIYPQYIILMVHPEYGNWNELKILLMEHGYEIKEARHHPTRPAYHCWRN